MIIAFIVLSTALLITLVVLWRAVYVLTDLSFLIPRITYDVYKMFHETNNATFGAVETPNLIAGAAKEHNQTTTETSPQEHPDA